MYYNFRHQVDDHNNRLYTHILLERAWETKFWKDRNCTWHIATSEVITNLAWRHFQKEGKVDATLDFRRKLTHECLVNMIGDDYENEDVCSRPLRTYRMPKKIGFLLAKALIYRRIWIPYKKMEQK